MSQQNEPPIEIIPQNPNIGGIAATGGGTNLMATIVPDPVSWTMSAVTPFLAAFGIMITAIIGIKLVQALIYSLQK